MAYKVLYPFIPDNCKSFNQYIHSLIMLNQTRTKNMEFPIASLAIMEFGLLICIISERKYHTESKIPKLVKISIR